MHIALGDQVCPFDSGAYNTRSIKSIPWIVVYMALGDQVHPFESGTYSTNEIKSIP
jgi:hypothetical protein